MGKDTDEKEAKSMEEKRQTALEVAQEKNEKEKETKKEKERKVSSGGTILNYCILKIVVRGGAGVAKRVGFRTQWLSAFEGSNTQKVPFWRFLFESPFPHIFYMKNN